MGENRTLIITDIHGCYDECRELLDKMAFDEENDTLINLGDTIDRGPKIYETFEYLRGLKEKMGDRCVLIRGNHEQMMLDAIKKRYSPFCITSTAYRSFWTGMRRCPITM